MLNLLKGRKILIFGFIFFLSVPYVILSIKLIQINLPLKQIKETDIYSRKNIHSSSVQYPFNVRNLIGLNKSLNDENLTGNNITVAVLDTGLYSQHEVFQNSKILAFYDAIEEKETNPEDIQWHGTYVTSILAGDSSKYEGVAPNANLIGVKVFDLADEETGGLDSSTSIVARGINWVLKNKDKYDIKVVSMSFGLDSTSDIGSIQFLNNLSQVMVEDGIVVVAAVGNDGGADNGGFGTITSPADARSIIGVGGVNSIGMMYSESSKGPSSEGIIKPDLCGPAVNIHGAFSNWDGKINDYKSLTGTSAATPMVSGLAALMLEKNSTLSPLEVKSIISLTSVKTTYLRTFKDNLQGWGIVQGYAALEALDRHVNFENNNSVSIFLGENNNQKKVWCRRLSLAGGMNYFFDLSWSNSAQAELYLFDTIPNYFGEPQLVATSINSLDLQRRCGLFVPQTQEYFIVVKLISGTGSGNFLLSLIFDYRVFIIVIISSVMVIGVIILIKNYKKSIFFENLLF